jgi:hypothetical protein
MDPKRNTNTPAQHNAKMVELLEELIEGYLEMMASDRYFPEAKAVIKQFTLKR